MILQHLSEYADQALTTSWWQTVPLTFCRRGGWLRLGMMRIPFLAVVERLLFLRSSLPIAISLIAQS